MRIRVEILKTHIKAGQVQRPHVIPALRKPGQAIT